MDYAELIRICRDKYDDYSAKEEDKILYSRYPHVFVLGCVMDSQLSADKAWNIPRLVASELGGYDFALYSNKTEGYYINLFNEKKYHRFNEKMAEAFYSAVRMIETKYHGNAAEMWNDNPTSAELVCRFLEFKRVGIKIATMAANLLSRDYKVPLKDYYAIDISPDIHVKRTMYRLGLLGDFECDDFASIDSTKVIYRAKSINPTFPGLLDLAFWEVGYNKICTNTQCNSDRCPFGRICPKQGIRRE